MRTSPVDLAAAAASELVQNAVMRNSLANHGGKPRAGILRRTRNQVNASDNFARCLASWCSSAVPRSFAFSAAIFAKAEFGVEWQTSLHHRGTLRSRKPAEAGRRDSGQAEDKEKDKGGVE